jgi:hypothetical protein
VLLEERPQRRVLRRRPARSHPHSNGDRPLRNFGAADKNVLCFPVPTLAPGGVSQTVAPVGIQAASVDPIEFETIQGPCQPGEVCFEKLPWEVASL